LTTEYAYDPRNLRELAVYPEDDEFQSNGRRDRIDYLYDGAARPRKLTDQGSNTITWAYDLAGRMATRGYPTGGNDTFTYDTDSRLLTASSARYNNLVTRTYDPVGRLASESLTVNTFGQTFTTQTAYNTRNEMTTITYPDATVVNRDYTARYQLQQVRYTDSVGGNHTLAVRGYDAGGRLTGTTYESTLAETRSYTRQDNLVTSINTTTVGGYAYTYDANKNRTAETATGLMANWGFTIPTGGHDAEDRLVNWQRNNGVDSQQWDLSFVADWTSTTINGAPELRTHDDAHELTARGAQTITYDPKGNIAQQPHAGVAQNYTWDYDNKLAAADTTGDGNADVTYTFDALGRRVSKTTVPTGVAIVYVCLGDQEIGQESGTGTVLLGSANPVSSPPVPSTPPPPLPARDSHIPAKPYLSRFFSRRHHHVGVGCQKCAPRRDDSLGDATVRIGNELFFDHHAAQDAGRKPFSREDFAVVAPDGEDEGAEHDQHHGQQNQHGGDEDAQ